MPRRILVLALVLLLLGMQQEAQWHALEHFGEWLHGPHERALLLPHDDGPCAICALFAGAATVAPNDSAAPRIDVPHTAVLHWDVSSPTANAPSFYLSRAPPPLL
jgi:hypothetical protein